jgi:hypothetical protein
MDQIKDNIVNEITKIAKRKGWDEIDIQTNIAMVSYIKGTSRVNIYYSRPWRLTVATIVDHPTMGRKQLFRKFIRMEELSRIFSNPRAHTGRGYYKRSN